MARLEKRYGLPLGSTEIVPNVELARGVMQTHAVCLASPWVAACLLASEDLAADLGAERSPAGTELAYARARFHLECVAALADETLAARRLGYRAKSCVEPDHAAVINRVLTPDAAEVEAARRRVEAFEAAQAAGTGRAEVDGSLVEVPTYLNAKRLIERAAALAAWSD